MASSRSGGDQNGLMILLTLFHRSFLEFREAMLPPNVKIHNIRDSHTWPDSRFIGPCWNYNIELLIKYLFALQYC